MNDSQPAGNGTPNSVETTDSRKKGDYKEAIAFCKSFKDKCPGSGMTEGGG